MRLIFLGTPAFAVPTLEAIVRAGHEVAAVLTQPDRPLGIINVHASLLPKYRGAGPIQWAIVRGETRTGVTTMRIDAGLDTGDMLLKAETEIGRDENAVELGARLAVMGAGLLVETLEGLLGGKIVAEKQDDTQATLAPLLKKEDGAIDWTQPAQAIHNRVRGLQPWPGAQTSFRGVPLHVWKTKSPTRGSGAVQGDRPTLELPGQFVSWKPP